MIPSTSNKATFIPNCGTAPLITRATSTPPPATAFKLKQQLLVEQQIPCSRRTLLQSAAAATILLNTGVLYTSVTLAAHAEIGNDSDKDDVQTQDTNDDASSFYSKWPYAKPSDILPYIRATASKNDAEGVLRAIDTFAQNYPMFRSGAEKGKLMEDLVAEKQPTLALELGTFMGYGSIRIARNLPKDGRLVTLEGNEEQAEVARQIIDWAGFSGSVQVVTGLAKNSLKTLAESSSNTRKINPATFIFLDHCKECYKPDLVLMEQLGFIAPGTVVLADNVKVPGAPGYLEYLAGTDNNVTEKNDTGGDVGNNICRYKTKLIDAEYEVEEKYKANWKPQKDAVAVSFCL